MKPYHKSRGGTICAADLIAQFPKWLQDLVERLVRLAPTPITNEYLQRVADTLHRVLGLQAPEHQRDLALLNKAEVAVMLELKL